MEFSFTRLYIVIKFIVLTFLVIFIPQYISQRQLETPIILKDEKFLLGIQNLLAHPENFTNLKSQRLVFVSLNDLKSKAWAQELGAQGYIFKKIFLYSGTVEQEVVHHQDTGRQDVLFSNFMALDIKEALKDIDVFIVDLSFSGVRSDPIVKLITDLLSVCAVHKKQLIILDRPNPLGGIIEGPGVIPYRFGVTLGELAHYINHSGTRRADLIVIPMAGFNRQMEKTIVNAAQISLKKMYGYGFFSLYGAINPLDIGLGTTDAYNVLTLPKTVALSNWETKYFKKICADFGLHFITTEYQHHEHTIPYKGIRLHAIKNLNVFSSFNSFLTISKFLLNRKQITLKFLPEFDTLTGSSDTRNYLLGFMTFEKLKKQVEDSMSRYFEKSKHLFLYTPHPKIYQICLFNGAHD